jgi:hypothetical protein
MLAGNSAAMLPEWLDALAASAQRVPEELVPDYCDRPSGSTASW